MASLDDILTTQKNGVVAINSLNRLFNVLINALNTNLYPADVSTTVQASTTQLIVAGTGRIFAVSIPTHSGSAQISIYNSATTGGIAATNLIYKSLPSNAAAFTPYQTVNLAYTQGIVIVTDAGITCCVAYTPSP